jgi:hypothetical protein
MTAIINLSEAILSGATITIKTWADYEVDYVNRSDSSVNIPSYGLRKIRLYRQSLGD